MGQKEREIVWLGEADRLGGGEVNKREPHEAGKLESNMGWSSREQ